ncbi:hypothetical protein PR048_029789 [Dryococelus australis]|uniref:Reverse transcriptase domain-containing protein n=1 Tax=Dryococelus australis TaxID=614101 RepID=A0ABQ9GA18_9NEOP|nr:hypothetical protein PR048_029789 [Dryococelus australis]
MQGQNFLKARSVAILLRTRVHEALCTSVTKNGSICICADYSNTVNTCVQQNMFSISTIKELLVNLGCSEVFSQFDGLMRVRRLPQGPSAAPGIFQNFMEQLLSGLQGVAMFLDDIVIAGSSVQEHDERLKEVLHRINEVGMTLNKGKLRFLGFIVNKARVQPDCEKGKLTFADTLHRLLKGNTTWNFGPTEREAFKMKISL